MKREKTKNKTNIIHKKTRYLESKLLHKTIKSKINPLTTKNPL